MRIPPGDVVDYSNITGGPITLLPGGIIAKPDGSQDTLAPDIEHVTGPAGENNVIDASGITGASINADLANDNLTVNLPGDTLDISIENFVSVFGTDEADVIIGGGDDNTLVGGDGADAIRGDAGSDSILGGDGNDVIDAGKLSDAFPGDDGFNTVRGGEGADHRRGEGHLHAADL